MSPRPINPTLATRTASGIDHSRRPVVKIEPAADTDKDRTWWIARCCTGGCSWESEPQLVKSMAEKQARWHRGRHRAAEPLV